MTQTKHFGQPVEGSLLKAALFVNGGVLLFSVMGVLIKFAAQHFDALQIATIRNIGGAAIVFVMLARQMNWNLTPKRLVIRQWPMALARGLSVSLAQACFFFALTRIELATAQTIAYAAPMFVTAMSTFMLGDRVGVWRWGAVVGGFLGVLLVLRPFNQDFDIVMLLPLAAAAGYGFSLVTVRMFDKTVSTLLINNYSSISAVVLSIGYVLVFSDSGWSAPMSAWIILVAIGLIGGFGVYFISAGYREVAPSKVAPFDYFGLMYGLILGWWFFAEAPFDRLFPGALLIIGAGMLIMWRERVSRHSYKA